MKKYSNYQFSRVFFTSRSNISKWHMIFIKTWSFQLACLLCCAHFFILKKKPITNLYRHLIRNQGCSMQNSYKILIHNWFSHSGLMHNVLHTNWTFRIYSVGIINNRSLLHIRYRRLLPNYFVIFRLNIQQFIVFGQNASNCCETISIDSIRKWMWANT